MAEPQLTQQEIDTQVASQLRLDASPGQRQRTRIKYRAMISDLAENRTSLVTPASTRLRKHFAESQKLFEGVAHVQEANLDTEFHQHASEILVEKAQGVNTTLEAFDPDEFVSAYRRRLCLGPDGRQRANVLKKAEELLEDANQRETREWSRVVNDLDWTAVSRHIATLRTPALEFLYGPLSVVRRVKPRKPVKRRDQGGKVAAVKPKRLKVRGEATADFSARTVEEMIKLLDQESRGMPELLIDPTSFDHTVHNFFNLSHIVKPGEAGIGLDERGIPTVERRQPPESSELYEAGATRHQLILPLTYAMWERMRDTFGVRKSMLPTWGEMDSQQFAGTQEDVMAESESESD